MIGTNIITKMERDVKIRDEAEVLKQFDGMVKKMAHQWCLEPRASFDDMVSEGNMAVLKAYRNFNPGKGAKLSTYVYHSINHALIAYRKENSFMLHCSTHHQKKDGERDRARKQEKSSVSLDKTLKNGFSVGSMVEASGLSPLENAERKEEWELLKDAMNNVLDDREQCIVKESNKWFGHKTLEDLGHDLGVSRQRVHQIEQNVFAKLSRRLSHIGELI